MFKSAATMGLTMALVFGASTASQAQSPKYDSAQGSPGVESNRPRGGHRMIAREALQGPPAPAILRDSVGLTGDKPQRYTQRYTAYMKETSPARDSLRNSMRDIRASFQNGDRPLAHSRREALSRQAADLNKRDKDFEKSLKQDLSKDQQKRYDAWKEAHEKAQHRQRDGHGRHSASNL
jgi:hypothetical protein